MTGRGTGGSVTYGDPDIGGRLPRYQNWNAGVPVRAAPHHHGRRVVRRQPRRFPRRHERGFYSNQLDPKYLVLGNLLTQQATPANIAAAQAIVPGIGLPYPNFSGTISQMLRPFPQYSAVTDVYGNISRSNYHSLQLTAEKRRSDDGLRSRSTTRSAGRRQSLARERATTSNRTGRSA